MRTEHDYIQDIAEIRSMMERSSKFMSLSGWAGILAGVYALTGAYVAYTVLDFHPIAIMPAPQDAPHTMEQLPRVMLLGVLILILAVGTAITLSSRRAAKRGEKIWNAASRQLATSMAGPLVTGGILILMLMAKGMPGLAAPLTLLFYGLALFQASKFTLDDVKFLGLIQMGLGLLGAWFVEYGLLLWALGFGIVHILYGTYLYVRYER